MNNEERILGMLETMIAEQQKTNSRLDTLEDAMVGVREDMTTIKQDAAETKAVVVRIENEHGQKLDALLDGYKQNADQLDRIQSEVTRHEEVILRRVK